MIRGLVIAAVAVTGCGAAQSTPADEPEPRPSRGQPEPCSPESSGAEPSSAEPSDPTPIARAECPQSVSELQAAQGESGFWCWRRTAGELVGEGECYRRKAACDDWHDLAVNHGNAPTECARMDSAVCFDMADHRKQRIHYRCLFTPEDCELLRSEMAAKYIEFKPGECRPTR